MERVVITGMGVVAPSGSDLPAFKTALREGKSGVTANPEMAERNMNCRIAGIPARNPALERELFTEEDLRGMNSNMIYGGTAALSCWRDAGLGLKGDRANSVDWDTGAIIGSIGGGLDTVAHMVHMVDQNKGRRLGSMISEQMMGSAVVAKVADLLGLGGHVTANSTACATGTEALIEAYHRIRAGRATRILAGGSEGSSAYAWTGFDSMRLLNTHWNDQPEKGSRPLSGSAAGFVPAAGAGVLLVESLSSARERGARIYAEILGGHMNCGGMRTGGTMTAPNPEGVVRCIRGALDCASIQPEQIDLINGHFTGTMADVLEVRNWQAALGLSPTRFPRIQATKSLVGHTMAAAGSIESIAAILQLHEGFLHPSANCEDIHPELADFAQQIPMSTERFSGQIAAKTSFGFGDVNSCIIFKKWE